MSNIAASKKRRNRHSRLKVAAFGTMVGLMLFGRLSVAFMPVHPQVAQLPPTDLPTSKPVN